MGQVEGNVKLTVNANQAEQELRKLEAKASELRQEIIKINKQEWVDKDKLRVLHKELKDTEKQQRELKKSMWDYKKVLENLSGASLRDLNKAYRQLNFELSKLERGTDEWKKKASQLASVKAEIGSVRQKMRELETGTKKTDGFLNKLVDGFNKFGGAALTAIAGVTAAITGLVVVIKNMLNTIAEWEDSFTDVLTLMTGDEIEKYGKELEQGAIDVMKKYGLEIRDVNKSLFDTVSAGVDAAHSIEVLDAAAKLATGGATELSVATDGLTTVINAFHLSTQEAGNVADAFFSAQKYGKTTVEELASSVGKVAPVMNAAGLSYQETLAALAELTKNGISTAEATTYLKGAMSSLLKPTKEAEKVLREYGVPVGATEIKQAGLTKTLEKFNEMMAKNPDVVAKAMPNLEGMTAIMSLTGDSFEDFKDILEQVNTDIGEGSSLMEAYGIKTGTIAFKMKQTKAEYKGAIVEMKDSLAPFLMDVYQGLTSVTKAFSRAIRNNIDGIKNFFHTLKTLNKIFNPLVIAVRNLVAALRIMGVLYDKLKKKVKDFLQEHEGLAKGLKAVADTIKNIVNKVIGFYEKMADLLPNLAKQLEEEANKDYDIKVTAQSVYTEKKQTEETTTKTEEENTTDKKDDKNDVDLDKLRQDTEALRKIIEDYRRGLISDAEAKAREDVEVWKRAEEEKIRNMVASQQLKNEALAQLEEVYQKKMNDIDAKYAAEREKKIEGITNFIKAQEQALYATREELIAADIAKIEEKYNKQIELAQQLAEQNPAIREEMLTKIEELEKLKADEIAEYKKKKEEELEKAKLQTREKYGLVSDEERMQMELEQLQEFYDQKLLSDEEYEIAKAGIQEKYRLKELKEEEKLQKEKQKIQKKYLNDSLALLNYMDDFIAAAKEEDLSRTERTEEEKKKIEKKYATMQLAVTIGKITANTALAIMKAIAELGPIAGPIAAFMIGATGALQIAAAANEKAKIQGMESGGLWEVERAQDGKLFKAALGTDRGLISRPTVLVAEAGPEYVIPNEGLQNKHVMNFVMSLEAARRAGQLRSFEPPKSYGYAEGGSTGTIEVKADSGTEELSAKMDTLIAKFDEFSVKIDKWATNLSVDYYSFKSADTKIKQIEANETI